MNFPNKATKVDAPSAGTLSNIFYAKHWYHQLMRHVDISRDVSASPKDKRCSYLSRADKHTIEVDVARSSSHWDIHTNLSAERRNIKRKKLKRLIENLAMSVSGFRYYQGIHEVCLVVLEVCGEDDALALPILQSLIELHFSHFVREDLHVPLLPMLRTISYIIEYFSPKLLAVCNETGIGTHFAIPWILTWFAHSLESFEEIKKVFSFLIDESDVRNNTSILFLCAAVIIANKKKILHCGDNMDMVLKSVYRSPRDVDIQHSIELAQAMRSCLPTLHWKDFELAETIPLTNTKCTRIFGKVSLIGTLLVGVATVVVSFVLPLAMESIN